MATTTLHATCCAAPGNGDGDPQGVLLTGPSGSGKSDLALRLIDAGFRLVADDLVDLAAEGGAVIASGLPREGALIEVRGLGVIRLAAAAARARVVLVVALAAAGAQERLPAPSHATLVGLAVPLVTIDPSGSSAVARIRLALSVLGGGAVSVAGALGDAPSSPAGRGGP
ncbi:HPr kinase/phosphorylase [Elioraea sp.]|uniref:HPr kinase/phosphorylase n=1 Tax=Elioraea sp. TaxID=2185103 RepID=UPI0025C09D66|nr:aldolase [Elioraea sp.]